MDHNAINCPRQARDRQDPWAARLPPRPARLAESLTSSPTGSPFRWVPSGDLAATHRQLGQFTSRLVPNETCVHLAAGPSKGSWNRHIRSSERRTKHVTNTMNSYARVVLGLFTAAIRLSTIGTVTGRSLVTATLCQSRLLNELPREAWFSC